MITWGTLGLATYRAPWVHAHANIALGVWRYYERFRSDLDPRDPTDPQQRSRKPCHPEESDPVDWWKVPYSVTHEIGHIIGYHSGNITEHFEHTGDGITTQCLNTSEPSVMSQFNAPPERRANYFCSVELDDLRKVLAYPEQGR